jgi:hypothetical protein
MADVKITDLAAIVGVNLTDVLETEQPASGKVTVQQLRDFLDLYIAGKIKIVYANIAARDLDAVNLEDLALVEVTDASADPNVTSGAAWYRWNDGGGTFVLVASEESLRDNMAASIQNNVFVYGVDSGIADAYATILTPVPTPAAGFGVILAAVNANTGPSTLNVNALGAVAIVKRDGSALNAGDIPAGSLNWLVFNGVAYVLMTSDGGGGALPWPANIHFVSTTGNDLTAVAGDPNNPYATIAAAISDVPAATEGYGVMVMPGTYDEQVNNSTAGSINNKRIWIHFMPGAIIRNTDGLSATTFALNGSSGVCVITGNPLIDAAVGDIAHTAVITPVNCIYSEFSDIICSGTQGYINEAADGLHKVGTITVFTAGNAQAATPKSAGRTEIGNINVQAAASGDALEVEGTPEGVVVVGKIVASSGSVDGVRLQQEVSYLEVASIVCNGDGIRTLVALTNPMTIKIGTIVSGSECVAQPNWTDTYFECAYMRSTAQEAFLYNVQSSGNIFKLGRVISDTNYGMDIRANDDTIYYVDYVEGSSGAVRVGSFSAAPTGRTLMYAKKLAGPLVHWMSGNSAFVEIDFTLKGAIIEAGAAVGVQLVWSGVTFPGRIGLQDCEIETTAGDSIQNTGGQAATIEGFNVHSTVAADATDLTLTTITELF